MLNCQGGSQSEYIFRVRSDRVNIIDTDQFRGVEVTMFKKSLILTNQKIASLGLTSQMTENDCFIENLLNNLVSQVSKENSL